MPRYKNIIVKNKKHKIMNCPICDKKMTLSENITYEDMGIDCRNGYVYDYCCEDLQCTCEGIVVYEKIENAEM